MSAHIDLRAYEWLLGRYGVLFEGLPEPVLHSHYYPMGGKDGPWSETLWNEFRYSQGLKEDKDPERQLWQRFADTYEADLRSLFDGVLSCSAGMHRGVVTIPSSTKGVTNRVTELTRRVLAGGPQLFDDLTRIVTRSRSKGKAHSGGGRSYREGFDTLYVENSQAVTRCDIILVLDDILTTGTSFRAMDARLRASGFSGTIVNYAFSRTLPAEGVAYCLDHRSGSGANVVQTRRKKQAANGPVEALVLDLDQTLLDDPVRNMEFEERLPSPWRGAGGSPYSTYVGVPALTGIGIPFAIVSNRPTRQLEVLLGPDAIRGTLHLPAGFPLPPNVFSFPMEERGSYTVRHYKPSPRGVSEAASYLRREALGGRTNARIVGLGNTYEDIVAYSAAGLESALALWGVPASLKTTARQSWGADHTFDSITAFVEWVKTSAELPVSGATVPPTTQPDSPRASSPLSESTPASQRHTVGSGVTGVSTAKPAKQKAPPSENPSPTTAAKAVERFVVGDRVAHKTFGPGIVVAVQGDSISVRFDRTGKVKLLMRGVAPMVKGERFNSPDVPSTTKTARSTKTPSRRPRHPLPSSEERVEPPDPPVVMQPTKEATRGTAASSRHPGHPLSVSATPEVSAPVAVAKSVEHFAVGDHVFSDAFGPGVVDSVHDSGNVIWVKLDDKVTWKRFERGVDSLTKVAAGKVEPARKEKEEGPAEEERSIAIPALVCFTMLIILIALAGG